MRSHNEALKKSFSLVAGIFLPTNKKSGKKKKEEFADSASDWTGLKHSFFEVNVQFIQNSLLQVGGMFQKRRREGDRGGREEVKARIRVLRWRGT
ncbi:hypothetical protein CEXT_119811 [Caerostris extrusa]|uniref:Uncharacterized protein n=1 Tax=Caerostris extrusa TaxID=172846 RepID=A0AAV4U4Z3_CAEEX|nr:hypothetical protein CEXT_119811 [Caerostris extrusa]